MTSTVTTSASARAAARRSGRPRACRTAIPGVPTREEIASGIGRAYGKPLEQAVPIPITGHPAEAAERLAAYRDAGASHLVMGVSGGDWRRQCDLLAEARAMPA